VRRRYARWLSPAMHRAEVDVCHGHRRRKHSAEHRRQRHLDPGRIEAQAALAQGYGCGERAGAVAGVPDDRLLLRIEHDKRRPQVDLVVLDLTDAQREFVLRHVDWDHARADVRIRLALGVDIPRRVELHTFPDVILTEIPSLRDYRFITVDKNVVICDPETRDVVLIVSS
jgi:uncharacterized protein DUF1236